VARSHERMLERRKWWLELRDMVKRAVLDFFKPLTWLAVRLWAWKQPIAIMTILAAAAIAYLCYQSAHAH